ncbi:hypothetical protein SAMCFNEI73_Ch2646 [Sinorhizobium americanum]|uniref:Uncharacterized protein n=1 Tax=Sinorhizobium americanum TaxID=194963 RepID=A0A1L3LP98_9HYPH|nr:hypothetical protein SAMCFNEI73_Ch2646 [Sinorhizobium americanum]
MSWRGHRPVQSGQGCPRKIPEPFRSRAIAAMAAVRADRPLFSLLEGECKGIAAPQRLLS